MVGTRPVERILALTGVYQLIHHWIVMALYFRHNGQQTGPFLDDDIHRMLKQGAVNPDDMVWESGMEGWAPLRTVRGFRLPPESPPIAVTAAPPALSSPAAPTAPSTGGVSQKPHKPRWVWPVLGCLGVLGVCAVVLLFVGLAIYQKASPTLERLRETPNQYANRIRESLPGMWESDDGKYRVEFTHTGHFTKTELGDPPYEQTGKYSVKESGTGLLIEYSGLEGAVLGLADLNSDSWGILMEDNEMTLWLPLSTKFHKVR